ncbi:MAG: ABC transporter substrate-binding protein [Magnetococcales bacterium]|nr:ABC transporter substrate-binding protein [Magnetococcales bacterium]
MDSPLLPARSLVAQGGEHLPHHITILAALVVALGVAWLQPALATEPETGTPIQQTRYSHYPFGTDESVIDFGTQPLWLPAGLITEVMRRDGILRETLHQQGKTIRFHPFMKGADVNRYIHDGVLEGGVGGDMPAITACATDQVRVVSLMDRYFTAVVAPTPLLLSDLRGRRIAYAPGSNAHYGLLSALTMANLTPSDVTLVPMEVDIMPIALQQGYIDAFSAWEPTPGLAVDRYGHKIVHRFLSAGYLYFSQAFATQQSASVTAVVAAEIRALRWLAESDDHIIQAIGWTAETIQELIGRRLELSQAEMLRLIRRSLRILWDAPLIPKEIFSATGSIGLATQFLAHTGAIPATLSWAQMIGCFDRTVGEEVLGRPLPHRLNTFTYGGKPQ